MRGALAAACALACILSPAREFLGRPFSEPKLIQLAHAYESASHARVLPKTTPRLPGERFPY